MGRIYVASFSGQAETVQCDLIEITAASTDYVLVHEVGISQLGLVQDAEEEMLLLKWNTRRTTSGSVGNTSTIIARSNGSPTSNTIIEDTNTTKGSGGSTAYQWYWNVRVPFQMIWTPETRPFLAPSERASLELATTPAVSTTFGGYIVFEEFG